MINIIFAIGLILSSLVSCSTVDKDQEKSNLYYAGYSNSDFKKETPVSYDEYKDVYQEKISEDDSLSHETIARIDNDGLRDIADSSDPISKASALCYQKKFNEALSVLDQAYNVYKNHPGYWNQMGTCHYLMGKNKLALTFYNKAKDINKEYAPAINNIGVLYQDELNSQKALVAYKEAARLSKFSLTPIFNLANIYLQNGFVQEAKQYFSALYNKNTSDVDVTNGLANCYLQEGNYGRAIELYETIDSKYQRKVHIGLNYALALKYANRDSDAKKIFSKLDKISSGPILKYYLQVKKILGE